VQQHFNFDSDTTEHFTQTLFCGNQDMGMVPQILLSTWYYFMKIW